MSKLISDIKNGTKRRREEVVKVSPEKVVDRHISHAKEVFAIGAEAIIESSRQLDDNFSEVVKRILACNGRVIVCGMGKSGIIGRKIACTLTSTGTPSFFIHAAEAFHGDLGMIKKEDILLMISYSGETEEVLKIMPFLKDNGNLIVSMTGNAKSTLAKSSDYHLSIKVKKEACPLRVAPTTSAVVALMMGDAITVALMRERGFRTEDYARFHPGGNLGRMLLTKVHDVMIKDDLPIITKTSNMKDVIQVMTSSRLGVAVVVDEKQYVIGIITDGDLRRTLNKYENILTLVAGDIMTKNTKTIRGDMRVFEAEKVFKAYEISTLIVTDDKDKLQGLLQIHNA